MAIPKKKCRTIIVNNTKYYWRKESNICLYIETGRTPNFIIKAFFHEEYFAVPGVVGAVINYTLNNELYKKPLIVIENGNELFKTELERQQQKRKKEDKERKIKWEQKAEVSKQERIRDGWDEYRSAKKCIAEKNYFEAILHLLYSIRIDLSKKERWSLLENCIPEDIKDAVLLNERACYYRRLSKYEEEYKSYCRKAAFNDIEEALKLDPNCAIAYGTLAELLFDEKDLDGFYYNWEIALQKGMTQQIDGWIAFDLKEAEEFIRISKKYLE
jgi:tetratricopeptide (TPR) repeat protein